LRNIKSNGAEIMYKNTVRYISYEFIPKNNAEKPSTIIGIGSLAKKSLKGISP
jgi:hypothetical protein